MNLSEPQLGFVFICTFRYALGRRSSAVSDCVDLLVEHWNNIPINMRNIIQHELEQAFVKDDETREHGGGYKPLGDDCDRWQWERVRRIWDKDFQRAKPSAFAEGF
jgi:hypothetical protein